MYLWKKQSSSFRGALRASGVMAFAGLGDAILYPVLPVYGKELGFSVIVIGVLLSVNRFVRILANTPIANAVAQIGMRKMLLVTAVLATLTTFVYGMELGMISFLIARILWGLSFSGLKTATLNYAALSEKKSGLAFGFSQSIKSLGPLFVLWFGPVVIGAFGIQKGLFSIAALSSLGILLAYSLPKTPKVTTATMVKTRITFAPGAINLLVFVLSISIEGILVVTLAHLLAKNIGGSEGLLAVVAFYLLLNKLFTFLFSLIGGVLTIRIKPETLFLSAVFVCVLALALIAFDQIVLGIVLAFMFNTLIVAFAPLIAMKGQGGHSDSLQAISSVSTWRDFGAGVGAFIGIYAVELVGVHHLFLSLFALSTVLFINYYVKNAESNSPII